MRHVIINDYNCGQNLCERLAAELWPTNPPLILKIPASGLSEGHRKWVENYRNAHGGAFLLPFIAEHIDLNEVGSVALIGFSAGAWGVREILSNRDDADLVSFVYVCDGLHGKYVGNQVQVDPAWVYFARRALARQTMMVVSYSNIQPPNYPGTRQSADALHRQVLGSGIPDSISCVKFLARDPALCVQNFSMAGNLYMLGAWPEGTPGTSPDAHIYQGGPIQAGVWREYLAPWFAEKSRGGPAAPKKGDAWQAAVGIGAMALAAIGGVWLLRRGRRKDNPILAEPPVQMHSLKGSGGSYFKHIVGRSPSAQDYYGVHTTGNFEIAMAYAQGTADQESDPDAYPVVISLCVDGLDALPDVDAVVKATEASQAIRHDAGDDVIEEAESFESIREGNVVGEDPYYVYIGAIQEEGNIAQAFADAAEDPQKAWDEWKRTGSVPVEVATSLVQQRRYPYDFDLSRVVRVDAIQTVWREILDDWWASEDEELEHKADVIKASGHAVITFEDIVYGNIPAKKKAIYEGSLDQCGHVEYHGTSSTRLKAAFPELQVPPPPFPVSEVDDDDWED
jgi:hypothetical protein